MCFNIISGQSSLTKFCCCSMLQSRWNPFGNDRECFEPSTGHNILGHFVRCELIRLFCISTCELWLQTTPSRDLRVALGHVLNQTRILCVFQVKFHWQPFSFVFLFCKMFPYCISIAFSSSPHDSDFCLKVHGAHNSVILFDLFGQSCQIM